MKTLTAAEVARLLRVRTETVCRYAREGTIPAARIGGMWRFDRDEIRRRLAGGGRRRRPPVERPNGSPDDDPLLGVIGIGSDGRLSRDIDAALYGSRR